MKIPKTAIGFMLLIGLAYAQPWYAASTRSIEYAIGTVRLMPHIETCSRDMVAAKAKEFRCIATSDLQERLLLVVAILEKAKASRSKWLFLGSSSGIEGALARWAVFGGISERGHGSSQNVAMGLAAARLLTTGSGNLCLGDNTCTDLTTQNDIVEVKW